MARKHRTITEALKPYKATTLPASRQNDVEPDEFVGFASGTEDDALPSYEPWPTQTTWLDDTEM